MAALLFTNNPTTAHMRPMVSEIKIFFDEGGAVVFSEGQTEKQLPAGASLKAIVAFHDGSSSLYKPNNQVNFGEGQSISLICKYGVNSFS